MKRRGPSAAAARLGVFGLALLTGCAGKQPVKLGAVLPLTGPAGGVAEIAESLERGLELAFEQLQADPEIEYELELEVLDSRGDAEKAGQLAEQLYATSIALIGGVTTEEAMAMAEVSKRTEKLLLSPSATGDQLSSLARTTFYRLFPSGIAQASAMASFAKQRLQTGELAVVVEDRAFSYGVAEGLRTVFMQYGGTIVAEVPLPATTTDFGPIVDQALLTDASAIYLATGGAKTVDLVKLLRARGFGTTEGRKRWILTTSAFAHPEVLGRAGPAADGVYLTAPLFDVESATAPMPAFVTAYQQKYGEEPDLYAGHGYDAVLLFGAALKKAPSANPSELQKAFRSMGEITGVSGSFEFDENGDAERLPRVHVIRDGELVDFQQWYERRQEEIQEQIDELRGQAPP